MSSLSCFKAYDVRGKIPGQLNPALGRALGNALRLLGGKRVVIGHDARQSSPMLANALMSGLEEWGADIALLGLCGTEEIYDAAANGSFDIGVMVTGSHNPVDENGFKIVRAGAIPVSADSGLKMLERDVIAQLEKSASPTPPVSSPKFQKLDMRPGYIRRAIACAGISARESGGNLRVAVDCGNGCAGPVLEKLAAQLPFEFVLLNSHPDGSFPNGVPNPLLPEMRASISRAVAEKGADIGVSFDGDFDRCFFHDKNGAFINGSITAAILAKQLLASHPGEKIIHDTRVYWNIQRVISESGGRPVMSKCGHAFIKERMRKDQALFGGETSGHYFYRDFAFCDSGIITMLLMLAFLQSSNIDLAAVAEKMNLDFPSIDEKNFRVSDSGAIIERVWSEYSPKAILRDTTDGINLEFPEWRFNLRPSNTESLLRLNLETRGNTGLLKEKYNELAGMIEALA